MNRVAAPTREAPARPLQWIGKFSGTLAFCSDICRFSASCHGVGSACTFKSVLVSLPRHGGRSGKVDLSGLQCAPHLEYGNKNTYLAGSQDIFKKIACDVPNTVSHCGVPSQGPNNRSSSYAP